MELAKKVKKLKADMTEAAKNAENVDYYATIEAKLDFLLVEIAKLQIENSSFKRF